MNSTTSQEFNGSSAPKKQWQAPVVELINKDLIKSGVINIPESTSAFSGKHS